MPSSKRLIYNLHPVSDASRLLLCCFSSTPLFCSLRQHRRNTRGNDKNESIDSAVLISNLRSELYMYVCIQYYLYVCTQHSRLSSCQKSQWLSKISLQSTVARWQHWTRCTNAIKSNWRACDIRKFGAVTSIFAGFFVDFRRCTEDRSAAGYCANSLVRYSRERQISRFASRILVPLNLNLKATTPEREINNVIAIVSLERFIPDARKYYVYDCMHFVFSNVGTCCCISPNRPNQRSLVTLLPLRLVIAFTRVFRAYFLPEVKLRNDDLPRNFSRNFCRQRNSWRSI